MRMLFVIIIFAGISPALAQRTADVVRNNTFVSPLTTDVAQRGGQVSLLNQGTNRIAQLQDLFGAVEAPFNHDGLAWPPVPRYWWQQGYSGYIEAKGGIGLPPGVPFVSLNRTYSFKYEVATTFHVLGTLRFLNRESQSPLNDLLPIEFEKVFKRDYVTMQEWFNVSPQNPMVGMCQYEIALYHGVTTSGGVSFILSGIIDGGRVNYARMGVWSRMFEIKPQGPNDEYSSDWYLNHECTDRFQKYTKAFVEDSLSFKAQQFHAYFHPANTCAPARPVPGQTDRDCRAWHDGEGFWNRKKPENTVGRCEMQSNGESHCVLKSKEGQKCPLYYTDGLDTFLVSMEAMRNQRRAPARPTSSIDHGIHSLATPGHREYPCDSGLTCTMDSSRDRTATCKNLTRRGPQ